MTEPTVIVCLLTAMSDEGGGWVARYFVGSPSVSRFIEALCGPPVVDQIVEADLAATYANLPAGVLIVHDEAP